MGAQPTPVFRLGKLIRIPTPLLELVGLSRTPPPQAAPQSLLAASDRMP
jgi:hypothetical protein